MPQKLVRHARFAAPQCMPRDRLPPVGTRRLRRRRRGRGCGLGGWIADCRLVARDLRPWSRRRNRRSGWTRAAHWRQRRLRRRLRRRRRWSRRRGTLRRTRARGKLRHQRLRRFVAPGIVERQRPYQRRRGPQRRDVDQERQRERYPDHAHGDDVVPVSRPAAPIVHRVRETDAQSRSSAVRRCLE